MLRRTFLQLGPAGALATAAAHRSRPNILFVMTDQHRFDCLGANGNPIIKTPNLDRLAARSANFQNAFVQAPVCVPSRATWFTGRYPHSHRNRVNYTPLDPREKILPQYLQEAGYQTGSVGKLHLYPPTAEHARESGFDRVLLHDGVRATDEWSDYVTWRQENDPLAHLSYRTIAPDIPAGRNPYRMAIADEFTETSWVGLETRRFLKEMSVDARPFFLFSSFFQPHSPFLAPEPFDRMYDDVEIPLPEAKSLEDIQQLPEPLQKLILRFTPKYDMDRELLQWAYRTYYASVSQIDREVGKILDELEETGRADETVVVFSTDHGDQMLEHGLMGKNCFFEASVKIPFLISWPGRVKPGKYEELVETTDLLPTLFELCGIEEPAACQGRSLAGLINGEGGYEPRDAVFSENVVPEVITGGSREFYFEKGKGIKGVRHPEAKMIRTERWKLNFYGGGEGELYDLKNDPGEKRNLYLDPAHAKTVNELKDRLLRWLMTADETDQIAPRWLVG